MVMRTAEEILRLMHELKDLRGYISDWEQIFVMERLRDIEEHLGKCDLVMLMDDISMLSSRIDKIIGEMRVRYEEQYATQLRRALREHLEDIAYSLIHHCDCKARR
jgi:cell division protein ZapA (FtsZ GTPase activity inhibitor)